MKTIFHAFGCLMLLISTGSAQKNLNLVWDEVAEKHFDSYLAACPDREIRCIWYPYDSVRSGRIMSLDLSEGKVITYRKGYNPRHGHGWSSSTPKKRKLSDSQVETLKSLILNLPASVKTGERLDSVFISYQSEGEVEVRRFLRAELPRAIERLYDIGGGHIETTKKREQGRAGQPATTEKLKPKKNKNLNLKSEERSQ